MYFCFQAVGDDREFALSAQIYSVFCFQSVREDSEFALSARTHIFILAFKRKANAANSHVQRECILYFGFQAVGEDSELALSAQI